jgi:hypothetical protein
LKAVEAAAWLTYGWRFLAGTFLVWALAILVALLVREPRATAPLGFLLCGSWLLAWSVRFLLR